ncbi:hypothetical protein E2K62_23545, partial [Escherichia coli]
MNSFVNNPCVIFITLFTRCHRYRNRHINTARAIAMDPQPTPLAWQRMRVNQAHNTLYNSLNQAMQEPAFNSHYLADM